MKNVAGSIEKVWGRWGILKMYDLFLFKFSMQEHFFRQKLLHPFFLGKIFRRAVQHFFLGYSLCMKA